MPTGFTKIYGNTPHRGPNAVPSHFPSLKGDDFNCSLFTHLQLLLLAVYAQLMVFLLLGQPTISSTALVLITLPSFLFSESLVYGPLFLINVVPSTYNCLYFFFISYSPSLLDHSHQHTNMCQYLPFLKSPLTLYLSEVSPYFCSPL